MRENKVVYGLIGYGGMGRWHTEILSNVSEAVIGGIYDIKKEKREEAKEKGFFVYETEEAMLADPDIDVVLIATPNDCHKPIAIRAMHAREECNIGKTGDIIFRRSAGDGKCSQRDRKITYCTSEQTVG